MKDLQLVERLRVATDNRDTNMAFRSITLSEQAWLETLTHYACEYEVNEEVVGALSKAADAMETAANLLGDILYEYEHES